jgi:flagellar biosynthesis protein FlhB
MSEHGERTEQPTQRRLEDAQKKGQIARSAEVQTVFVLLGGLVGLSFFGHDAWLQLANALTAMLGHLHDTPLSASSMQRYVLNGTLVLLRCAGPVVLSALVAGLLAGALQSRFQTASEALDVHWERLNPVAGFQRVFSTKAMMPTGVAMAKLLGIAALTYGTVDQVLHDPIFASTVSLNRVAAFLADAGSRISYRVVMVLAVIAAADYGFQSWRTWRDLMMTKEEVKEEMKNQEGDPHLKANRRRMLRASLRKMLSEVPTADVVVTNPTRIAIALRYDRKTMKAPKLVAKGIRLNAARIREMATQHGVPMLENKPLARLLFKHGRVGGEVPAQLYLAVAEVLAWVYKTYPYRSFAAENRVPTGPRGAATRQNAPSEAEETAALTA